MRRFAITGPESSGKTTLTLALAELYNGKAISEFAREYLLKRNGNYCMEDLDIIAENQLALWKIHDASPLLFCDTEMLVMKVWSEFKYAFSSDFIQRALYRQNFDHYFLCRPDIAWEEDPLREHPEQRDELFEIYLSELNQRDLPFTIVEGDMENRLKICSGVLNDKR